MCECHPMTPEDERLWDRVKREPNTIEDWRDLHDAIEGFKRRKMERHRPCAKAQDRRKQQRLNDHCKPKS